MIPLSDEEIVQKCVRNVKKALGDDSEWEIEHFEVIRAVKAVTHFKVGSHKHRPRQTTSVENLMIAGDWVRDVSLSSHSLRSSLPLLTSHSL